MPRIPLLSTDSKFTPEQNRVLQGILGKRGGRIPGPYRFSLHCPELTEVWHPLGGDAASEELVSAAPQ